jgi:hypothetical protein
MFFSCLESSHIITVKRERRGRGERGGEKEGDLFLYVHRLNLILIHSVPSFAR